MEGEEGGQGRRRRPAFSDVSPEARLRKERSLSPSLEVGAAAALPRQCTLLLVAAGCSLGRKRLHAQKSCWKRYRLMDRQTDRRRREAPIHALTVERKMISRSS